MHDASSCLIPHRRGRPPGICHSEADPYGQGHIEQTACNASCRVQGRAPPCQLPAWPPLCPAVSCLVLPCLGPRTWERATTRTRMARRRARSGGARRLMPAWVGCWGRSSVTLGSLVFFSKLVKLAGALLCVWPGGYVLVWCVACRSVEFVGIDIV